MDRRQFLKGTIVAIAAAEATVRLATPAETALLETKQPVALANITPTAADFSSLFFNDPTIYMRSQNGKEYIPIGVVTSMTKNVEYLDAGQWEGEFQVTKPGIARISGTFKGGV